MRVVEIPTWPHNVWTQSEFETLVQEFAEQESKARVSFGAEPVSEPAEANHLREMIIRNILFNAVPAGCA